jgi:hypothetical protein
MKNYKEWLNETITGNVQGDLYDLIVQANNLRSALSEIQSVHQEYPEMRELEQMEKEVLSIKRRLEQIRNSLA